MRVFHQALLEIQNALAYIRKDSNAFYRFGENNTTPNELVRIVNDSGTASACISKLAQFIQANGLVDQTVGDAAANKTQSFNSVVSELALITSYFKASSFRVLYNNEGSPAAIYPVPCQKLRRFGNYTFVYNELMGEPGHRKNEDKVTQAFNPKEKVSDRLKRIDGQIKKYGEQFGDIVYHFRKGVGLYRDVYSVPDFYAGIDDIQSDSGVSRLELRNIKKGWRTPIIVAGPPLDDSLKDDNGETQWSRFSNDMKKFTGDDAAYAMYLPGTTHESQPKVTVISVADVLDATDKATDRIGRKVCRLMGVPPILVGFATPGSLGDVQELENTMQLFKMSVIESQALITESLKLVFPDQNWDLTTLSLWEQPKLAAAPSNPLPNEAGQG